MHRGQLGALRVRAELHLSAKDDPEVVLAALRERIGKLHAAVRR